QGVVAFLRRHRAGAVFRRLWMSRRRGGVDRDDGDAGRVRGSGAVAGFAGALAVVTVRRVGAGRAPGVTMGPVLDLALHSRVERLDALAGIAAEGQRLAEAGAEDALKVRRVGWK